MLNDRDGGRQLAHREIFLHLNTQPLSGHRAHRQRRSRCTELDFRCRILVSAPAATAGGGKVVEMKPEAFSN
jgi:hypothetical protein